MIMNKHHDVTSPKRLRLRLESKSQVAHIPSQKSSSTGSHWIDWPKLHKVFFSKSFQCAAIPFLLSYDIIRAGNTEWNAVFRHFGTTGDTFRYQNTKYNIDTDTERMIPNDFFRYLWISCSDKESSQYIRLIGAFITIITMHDKCCFCQLEIALNCCITWSVYLHFHHWRIDPLNSFIY